MAGTRADEYRALCITVPRQPKRGEKKKSSGCDGHTMNSNRSLLHQLRRCIRVRVRVYVLEARTTRFMRAREIDRSMITDGGERRTEEVEKEDVVTEESWSDRGGGMVEEEWCRKSEGNVSSLFLSLSIPYLSRFDEEGQRWKLGGETTRLTLVEPRSIIYGLVSNRHVSDQKGLDKGERSEASLNGTLLGGEI